MYLTKEQKRHKVIQELQAFAGRADCPAEMRSTIAAAVDLIDPLAAMARAADRLRTIMAGTEMPVGARAHR